jgi:hypothetical protein
MDALNANIGREERRSTLYRFGLVVAWLVESAI